MTIGRAGDDAPAIARRRCRRRQPYPTPSRAPSDGQSCRAIAASALSSRARAHVPAIVDTTVNISPMIAALATIATAIAACDGSVL